MLNSDFGSVTKESPVIKAIYGTLFEAEHRHSILANSLNLKDASLLRFLQVDMSGTDVDAFSLFLVELDMHLDVVHGLDHTLMERIIGNWFCWKGLSEGVQIFLFIQKGILLPQIKQWLS